MNTTQNKAEFEEVKATIKEAEAFEEPPDDAFSKNQSPRPAKSQIENEEI